MAKHRIVVSPSLFFLATLLVRHGSGSKGEGGACGTHTSRGWRTYRRKSAFTFSGATARQAVQSSMASENLSCFRKHWARLQRRVARSAGATSVCSAAVYLATAVSKSPSEYALLPSAFSSLQVDAMGDWMWVSA